MRSAIRLFAAGFGSVIFVSSSDFTAREAKHAGGGSTLNGNCHDTTCNCLLLAR
jgi:hypothetical protein